ncbi:MAG: HAMP domain-containing protein [Gorillibacterium sp.]|nr:HAMP domain-containing protein [Gorillibacterium sp.]
MTIIALVAVVLIILGLFLFRYIDTRFPNQSGSLEHKAETLAALYKTNIDNPDYLKAANDLLTAEDSGMMVIDVAKSIGETPNLTLGGKQTPINSIFSTKQMEAIYSGKKVITNYYSSVQGEGSYSIIVLPFIAEAGKEPDSQSIILFQSMTTMENTQLYVKKVFTYVSIMGFLLTTIFGFFLIIRLNRPLINLQKAAGFIRAGDYKQRVKVDSNDEIGQLGITFNEMADQLDETIREVQNEKDNLGSVLRSMGEAVLSFNVDGSVIFLNPQGEKLLAEWSGLGWEDGLAESSVKDQGQMDKSRLIPSPLLPLFQSAIEKSKETASELLVLNSVWSVAVAPLYEFGGVRGAVAVLRDETEKTRSEKFRKDFVANVSHELRTPLSMLQGYSEALLDDIAGTPEERRELAQIINEESLRMGRLVSDLLDLARMETDYMKLYYKEMDLEPLIRRVQRKFSALCKEQRIDLEVELSDPFTHIEHGDEDRLEQVLTNLLDNAIRHTRAGGSIRIRSLKAELNGAPAVTVEVEDKGEGIPADDLPFVFERFYKADKARKRRSSSGTGLGLAIAKNIIEAHKGVIQVKSKLGMGTTFSITIPLSIHHD